MFANPSIDCEGWWEQGWLGRQPMEELRLAFGDGQIAGAGIDAIGTFRFSGALQCDGRVSMTKQYLGKHQVLYCGTYDGEGCLSGEWSVGSMRGPWLIALRRLADAASMEIETL